MWSGAASIEINVDVDRRLVAAFHFRAGNAETFSWSRSALAAVSTDVVSLWAASIAVLRVATVKALRKQSSPAARSAVSCMLLAGVGPILCDPEQIAGRILEQRERDHFRDDSTRQHDTPAICFDLGKNVINVVNAHIENLVRWIFTDTAAEPAGGT